MTGLAPRVWFGFGCASTSRAGFGSFLLLLLRATCSMAAAATRSRMPRIRTHRKCRGGVYPFSAVRRFPVDDARVSWQVAYAAYRPPPHESANLKNKPWSDAQLGDAGFRPRWHQLDGAIDRRSYEGAYAIVDGAPRNPIGRTGIIGRGILGKWGPNHAADPVVTRWKRVHNERILHPQSGRPILQFCAIQRHDNNEWAIPGGMVDAGERVSETLRREFMEEAMNSLGQSGAHLDELKSRVAEFFLNGEEFYKGYVDDPRNTDNAWMETVAVNFHDESGELVGKFNLTAGDDAKSVRWTDIDGSLALYASHKGMVEHVANFRDAHF